MGDHQPRHNKKGLYRDSVGCPGGGASSLSRIDDPDAVVRLELGAVLPLARDLALHGVADLHGVLELLAVELEHEHVVLAIYPVVRVFRIPEMHAVTEASRDPLE